MTDIIAELNALAEAIPTSSPEKTQEVVQGLRQLSPEVLDALIQQPLASLAAKENSAESFIALYQLVHGNVMPAHLQRAVRKMYEAHEKGRGFLPLQSRGFWKTTTLSETFDAFLFGHHAEGTGLVVGANDDSAEKITKAIATIIEHNPGWKLAFPHVIPDPTRGWAVGGYWVIDTRMDRSKWAQQQSAIIDPTFVGGGYKSSRLNGKHPSLFLNVDDSAGRLTARDHDSGPDLISLAGHGRIISAYITMHHRTDPSVRQAESPAPRRT